MLEESRIGEEGSSIDGAGQIDDAHHFELRESVLVSFTEPGRIGGATWDRYLAALAEHRPSACVLLTAGAIAVDAPARRRFTQAVTRTRTAVLVVTDNRLTRGWAMAMAWFGARLDVFGWHELARACARVELSTEAREQLYRDAARYHQHKSRAGL